MASPENAPIPDLFADEDARRVVTDNPSWENTLGFLAELTFPVDAINSSSPVDPKNWLPPIKHGDNVKNYDRRFEIFSRYAGYNETLHEVGQRFGKVTRERVRKISTQTLRALHDHAPSELQEKYPLESLSTDKRSNIEARMRLSLKMGGTSIRVAEAIEAGKSNRAIMKELKLTIQKLGDARKTLEGWGVEVPLTQKPVLETFHDLKNTDLTDEQVQALLDKVNHNWRYSALQKAGYLVNLSDVARLAGLLLSRRDIPNVYEVLNQQKMPTGRVPLERKGEDGEKKILGWYYFIATINMQKALVILQSVPGIADLKIIRQV